MEKTTHRKLKKFQKNQTVLLDGPILDCIYASAFRASSRKHSAVGSGTK